MPVVKLTGKPRHLEKLREILYVEYSIEHSSVALHTKPPFYLYDKAHLNLIRFIIDKNKLNVTLDE